MQDRRWRRGPSLEMVLLGALASGHILIEDLPGLGKTLLARAFAAARRALVRAACHPIALRQSDDALAGDHRLLNRRSPRLTASAQHRCGVALIAAGIILIPGAPLLSIALNANVLATVLLPVTLVFMILLAGDRQLMGSQANTAWLNMAAAAIVKFVAGCGAAYSIDSFLQATHLIPGG